MNIQSPLSGRIIEVCVQTGDRVGEGQTLLVLETMKMEYRLRSPLCGNVMQIAAVPEQRVTPEDVLLTIEA